jgi:predicted phage terminase large subunit-like protein
LRPDQNQKERFENLAAGFRIATGIDGKATGEGGDFIVTDDPHKAAGARSDTQRQAVVDWWENTMSTRLNDPKTGCHLVCMQRLHETDLSGWLIEQARGYDVLCLPAEYEADHPIKTFSSIGWEDPREEEGELLWPERFGDEEMQELKRALGTAYNIAGQLQQRPAPSDGGHFGRGFFQYFEEVEADGVQFFELTDSSGKKKRLLKSRCTCFQTCDTALKEGDDSNYTVVMTFYIGPDGEILVYHVSRDRIAVPKQYGFLIACRAANPDVSFQAVEEQQSGIGLIQEGRARGTPFRRMKAQGDKVQRTLQILTAYENGSVFHRSGSQAAWLNDFEDELQVFPNGRHDDQVDALAYGGKLAMASAMMQVGPLVLNDLDEIGGEEDEDGEAAAKVDDLANWIAERESLGQDDAW